LLPAVATIAVAVTSSIVLGVLAGLYRVRWPDTVISSLTLIGMSVPEFVVATLLVLALSITVPVLPAVVLDEASAPVADLLPAVVLPAAALSVVMTAYIVRMTRTSVIDVMAGEFVTTARLKGLGTWRVVVRHALPSALLPTLNVIAMNVAWLVGGVVVVENVFNYPGVGTLMLEAVHNRDLPVLQAIAVVSAAAYVLCNRAADLGALALDPRQRARERSARWPDRPPDRSPRTPAARRPRPGGPPAPLGARCARPPGPGSPWPGWPWSPCTCCSPWRRRCSPRTRRPPTRPARRCSARAPSTGPAPTPTAATCSPGCSTAAGTRWRCRSPPPPARWRWAPCSAAPPRSRAAGSTRR